MGWLHRSKTGLIRLFTGWWNRGFTLLIGLEMADVCCVMRIDGGIRRNAFQLLRLTALIDDVMTTGASLNELAKTLKQAGAAHVECWVIARTLPNY